MNCFTRWILIIWKTIASVTTISACCQIELSIESKGWPVPFTRNRFKKKNSEEIRMKIIKNYAAKHHADHTSLSRLSEFHSNVHRVKRSWHQSTWFKYRENHCSCTGCIMFNLTWTILPFHIIPYMTLVASIQKTHRLKLNVYKYCLWNASRNSFPIAASLLNSYIFCRIFPFQLH